MSSATDQDNNTSAGCTSFASLPFTPLVSLSSLPSVLLPVFSLGGFFLLHQSDANSPLALSLYLPEDSTQSFDSPIIISPPPEPALKSPSLDLALSSTDPSSPSPLPSILRKAPRYGGKALSVSWNPEISILVFPVVQSGSSSVPHYGSYSIGLGWTPSKTVQLNLEQWESYGFQTDQQTPRCKKRVPSHRVPEERLMPLDERERKKLLKQCKAKLSKSEAYHLAELRQSRARAFCFCSPPKKPGSKCCTSSKCPCVQLGINCQIESNRCCTCSKATCGNPDGFIYFDVSRMKTNRTETLNALGEGDPDNPPEESQESIMTNEQN